MENIEQIFEKVNKEKIELNDHKDKLRSVLMNSEYFETERSVWDWKTTISSLAFSSLLIIFAYFYPASYAEKSKDLMPGIVSSDNGNGLYNSLVKSGDASTYTQSWNNQEVKVVETVEENARVTYYFSNNNILVNSQVDINK